MSGSPIEHDFFGIEQKENASSSKPQFHKAFDQRRTFRGIQGGVSKMNPQLLKTVISSGVIADKNFEGKLVDTIDFLKPSSSNGVHENRISSFSLPLYNPRCSSEITPGTITTSPLTIFYNGTVSVFDVPRDKAEILMKLAENGNISKPVESSDSKIPICSSSSIDEQKLLLEKLNGDDLPIARKKSLQRFLEKRKERMSTVSPYANPGEVKEVGGSSTN